MCSSYPSLWECRFLFSLLMISAIHVNQVQVSMNQSSDFGTAVQQEEEIAQ